MTFWQWADQNPETFAGLFMVGGFFLFLIVLALCTFASEMLDTWKRGGKG